MITQKPLLVKVDIEELDRLNSTCNSLGINRNKFLNFLIHFGNDMMSNSSQCLLTSIYNSCLVSFK